MSSLCSICGLIFQEKWQLCDHNQKVHETRILKSNIGDDFEAIGQGKLDAHKKKTGKRCVKLVVRGFLSIPLQDRKKL